LTPPIDRERRHRREQQRMPIGRRARDRLRGEHGAAADAVSTTTVCLSCPAAPPPTLRVRMSVPPPGGKGHTNVIVRWESPGRQPLRNARAKDGQRHD